MSKRAETLAGALEKGARALASFASNLTESEWQRTIPKDGRKIGVVVHHVATVYPLEIRLAQSVAKGDPVVGVDMDGIHKMNAGHAVENNAVTKEETIKLLNQNSADAAAAIRALTDEKLDTTVPVSLYADAPLTCQFVLEDHAVRHSYHHLAKIRAALNS
jgi:DinB superfamily